MWNAIINRNHGVGGVGSSQEAYNQEHSIIGSSSVVHSGGIYQFFVRSLKFLVEDVSFYTNTSPLYLFLIFDNL